MNQSATSPATDRLGRPLGSLRISVTDRCNLRCQYCMPEEEYAWLSKRDILSYDELLALARVFTDLGVDRIRLTGGEPLLRPGLPDLVTRLKSELQVTDIALTTNGVLLPRHARSLRRAGLNRVTVSLDTLDPKRFHRLSRRGSHAESLRGVDAAVNEFGRLKIDTVVMKGFNHDELVELIEYGRTRNAEIRFIEYMDVGGATGWSSSQVYSRDEILADLSGHYGEIHQVPKIDAAPADRFRLPDGAVFGIISSTTRPFCGDCDRSRLTADGMLLRCLYARTGTDLRGPLRSGAGHDQLTTLVRRQWADRADQGAIDRLSSRNRKIFVSVDSLRQDPHLEMHTRGG